MEYVLKTRLLRAPHTFQMRGIVQSNNNNHSPIRIIQSAEPDFPSSPPSPPPPSPGAGVLGRPISLFSSPPPCEYQGVFAFTVVVVVAMTPEKSSSSWTSLKSGLGSSPTFNSPSSPSETQKERSTHSKEDHIILPPKNGLTFCGVDFTGHLLRFLIQ